ncbi:hypothetical protein [Secundilactobacillus collinoides]|uniref:hypothetical protein n=1 Tax=Secundilactobacillus collinoides TaxID=33960 RepID=UPI0006D2C9AE|nr:hypothetical protein [Secundilactobacillus collinoides]
MTLKDTLTYNEQLAVAKSLLKQPVSADDAAAHYANLQDLKQELDQELSRLDIRLHPVASKAWSTHPTTKTLVKHKLTPPKTITAM